MTKIIAFASLLLALIFEVAIFKEVPGIGYFFFWVSTFATTVYLLVRAERFSNRHLWMFLPSLLTAFSIFRFDAFVVRTWGALFFLATLAWAVSWNLMNARGQNSLCHCFPQGTGNPVAIWQNAHQSLNLKTNWDQDTKTQVLRGLVFASALLLVFGTLLVRADAAFSSLFGGLQNLFGGVSVGPTLRLFLWSVLTAGSVRIWLQAAARKEAETRSFFSPMELLISLGSLNILLGAFLMVQTRRVLGQPFLADAGNFSYADFARRGFFELTLCIILILPLVFIAYKSALANRDTRLRYLGGALIFSATGLALSALKRMHLYIDVYGLSVERFYAAAGIAVAMSILAWAGYACLKPQSVSWLLAKQNITVVFCLALLSLVNVDALVARSHLNLVASQVRSLDEGYVSQLSTDALPVFADFKNRLSGPEQRGLTRAKQHILSKTSRKRGFSFNISRNRALPSYR